MNVYRLDTQYEIEGPLAALYFTPMQSLRHQTQASVEVSRQSALPNKFCSEYIVYGNFECAKRHIYARSPSAYWVPLSKLIKNVTRATAMEEIETFEGNMAELRANEIEELSSEDEDDE